jgi:putative ATP-dependent endonuclease of OLD family
MTPRTFDEAFIYENISMVREKKLDVFVDLEEIANFDKDYNIVYETVKSDYKKVEFALNLISTDVNWKTPVYIVEGLAWLSDILQLKPKSPTNSVEQS